MRAAASGSSDGLLIRRPVDTWFCVSAIRRWATSSAFRNTDPQRVVGHAHVGYRSAASSESNSVSATDMVCAAA